MNKQSINLAILIPVFNNLDFTRRCLDRIDNGLSKASPSEINTKIIVIDDGSTDGTSDWISTNKKEIILLHGDGNLWWSGGINVGAKYAIETLKSDYILWWNNDIEPEESYFRNLYQRMTTNPQSNVIGSKIYMKNTNKVWGYGGYFNTKNGNKGMYGNWEEDKPEYQVPKLVDWLPGMGSVFHYEVFNKIGYLDQLRFPQYHGDSDYTLRAKYAGFTITVYPDLILFNDTSNSGLRHDDTVKVLRKSLTSVKSNYNFRKEYLFYHIHGKSILTYRGLAKKFIHYIGGFIKWKALSLVGIKRNKRQI